MRLAYRTWGDAFGSPVVLLHGLGGSAADWEAAGPLLGQEWRVFALDLRGHGESDWPDEYDLELMVEDVVGFLDELELNRVGLVGHGMGGVVARLLAQEHSDRVERLVLVETPAPSPATRARPGGPRARWTTTRTRCPPYATSSPTPVPTRRRASARSSLPR